VAEQLCRPSGAFNYLAPFPPPFKTVGYGIPSLRDSGKFKNRFRYLYYHIERWQN